MRFDPKLNVHRYAVERRGTAVIVIDMQNDFVHEKGSLSAGGAYKLAEPILPNIKRLLSASRSNGIPIVYTRQVSRPDQFDALPNKSLNIPRCVQGTWGAEVLDEIKPTDSDFVVDAPRRDRFYDSRLELILRKLGVSTLLFAGYASDGCVESTVRGADARDYKIVVLSDCTAADSPQRQDAALLSMSRVAMIAPADAVLEAIEVKATA